MLLFSPFLLEFTDFDNGNTLVKICIILIAAKEVMNEGGCEQSLPSLHQRNAERKVQSMLAIHNVNAKDRANECG
jgi:hypothetical protein